MTGIGLAIESIQHGADASFGDLRRHPVAPGQAADGKAAPTAALNAVLLWRLFWLARLAGVCVAGWLLRQGRRVARRGPRVWHGTFPMHMIKDMVEVDRRAGFTS